jgi:hypothetical protein
MAMYDIFFGFLLDGDNYESARVVKFGSEMAILLPTQRV